MKSPVLKIAVPLLLITVAWLMFGGPIKIDDAPGKAASENANQPSNVAADQQRRLEGWSAVNLPPDRSGENAYGGFSLRMEAFMPLPAELEANDFAHFPHLFENNDSLASLSNQLDLDPSKAELLNDFLKRAATAQTDLERSGLRAEKISPNHFQLTWTQPDAERVLSLKQELVSLFSEDLAMAIWIRGNMDHFHDPVPGWDGGAITLQLKQGTNANVESAISYKEWEWTYDVLNPEGSPHIQLRMDHLFDLPSTLVTEKPKQKGYPIAKPTGKPGFVFSPYTNKLVDVRDLPPGTLVQDPSMTPESKSYFRVPLSE